MARIRRKNRKSADKGGWCTSIPTKNTGSNKDKRTQMGLLAAGLLFGMLFIPSSKVNPTGDQGLLSMTPTISGTTAAPGGSNGGATLRGEITTTAKTEQSVVPPAQAIKQQQQNAQQLFPGDLVPEACDKLHEPHEAPLHVTQVVASRGTAIFQISLHEANFDKFGWQIMTTKEYYQSAWSAAFDEVLTNTKKDNGGAAKATRVLDVGANIGFFSLLAAAHGPSVVVDAFEPNLQDRIRFCESLHLNHWNSEYDSNANNNNQQQQPASQVNIYPFGIGQDEGFFTYQAHAGNPAQGGFVRSRANEQGQGTRVINLDHLARTRGWLASRPDIAILKVDVEGLDHFVLQGSSSLLKAQIIRHVFVEISLQGSDASQKQKQIQETKAAIKLLLEAGYTIHKVGGNMGPDKKLDLSDVPNDDVEAERIMEIGERDKDNKLCLWWSL